MRNLSTSLSCLAALGLATLPQAVHGFYPFETGELFITAEPQVQYDSNIFGNAAEQGDWLARVPVGLLVIRDAGHIRAEATGGVDFGFFKEYSSEDYSDPFARVSFNYDRAGHPLTADLRLGWWQQSQADALVGARTEVERRQVVLDGRYRTHQRLAWRSGLNYNHWDYSRGFVSKRDQWGARVGADFSYSPRLDIGLHYAYTHSDVERSTIESLGSDDHALFLGFSGQISPRLTQSVEVGAKHRSFKQAGRSNALEPYVALSLVWDVDEVTSLRVTGSSDFGYSPDNASISEQRVELAWRRQIDPKIAFTAAVHYDKLDFDYAGQASRDDDEYGARIAVDYTFTQLTSARFEALYLTRDSTAAFADYDRYIIGATLLIQY